MIYRILFLFMFVSLSYWARAEERPIMIERILCTNMKESVCENIKGHFPQYPGQILDFNQLYLTILKFNSLPHYEQFRFQINKGSERGMVNITIDQKTSGPTLFGSINVIKTKSEVSRTRTRFKLKKGKISDGVVLSNIPYPQDFLEKQLKSGLPTTISLRVFLLGRNIKKIKKIIKTIHLFYIVTYDLWDETFKLKIRDGKKETVHKDLKLDDVIHHLSTVSIQKILPRTKKRKIFDKVKFSILLNPLKAATIKKIQEWVSKNKKAGSPTSRVKKGNDGQQGGPRFTSLFNLLLKQYNSKSKSLALWHWERIYTL